jgi:hypothetical protein
MGKCFESCVRKERGRAKGWRLLENRELVFQRGRNNQHANMTSVFKHDRPRGLPLFVSLPILIFEMRRYRWRQSDFPLDLIEIVNNFDIII